MFRLPNEVKNSLKNYKYALEELQSEKLSPARFKGIRVPWGIYSHRGGKVFMTRIRISAALVTASQLEALAFSSRKYGSGILHITTRQDIQIHDVKIEDTIKIMEYLKEYNLSPRGGGGNTVRNVIGCHLSGICDKEVFDIRKHAVGIAEYLLRQDSSFNLPRKFKIAFSCCSRDCAGCLINDIGFIAKIENSKEGFSVFVGGGMGADSRIGSPLEKFIPTEDVGYCVAAIKNIFFKKGDRRNKHHNRLRFLIENIGLEEFKKLYKEEFQGLKEKEHIVLRKIDFQEPKEKDSDVPEADDKEYNEFLRYNVRPQKQNGFVSVELRIPRGDISDKKLTALADLESSFSGIEFRTTQNQNLILAWIRKKDIHKLFLKLKKTVSEFLYSNTLLDVVTCKGAVTCNLGLCNSPALTKEIEDVIKGKFIGKEVFKKLEIKINGCPNACGHQPIGKLSFHGMVRRVDNRPVPFYKFFIGGRKEAEKTRFGEEVGAIPARNILSFLRDFLEKAEAKIQGNKDVHEFLENEAKNIARETLKDYTYVPAHSENKNFYIDWGKTKDFSLEGLGPGECGAGVLDMIESDLTESKIALDGTEIKGYLSSDIRKALLLSARALLVVKGIDPKNKEEVFVNFREKFIGTGVASSNYATIKDVFDGVTDTLTLKDRKERFLYAKEFLEHIKQLYKRMDSSFNFSKQETGPQKEKNKVTKTLDLLGTPCPINYVKTKLVLENLKSGDILEILLDEGEPMDNVPKSLENDGHQILKIEKQDGSYKVQVKKK